MGSYLGDSSGHLDYASEKVRTWVSHLLSLTAVAEREPQAPYAALTKSLQNECAFIQCAVLGCDLFLDLEFTLFSQFLPVLFGSSITPAECRLFTLLAKFGGLGILILFSLLQDLIRLSVRHQEAISRDAGYSQLFDDLLLEFDAYHQWTIFRAKDQNNSAWLTSLARNQSAQEFRDALALRYKNP